MVPPLSFAHPRYGPRHDGSVDGTRPGGAVLLGGFFGIVPGLESLGLQGAKV